MTSAVNYDKIRVYFNRASRKIRIEANGAEGMSHKREAILEAFVQLLDEKPAKRITVNDIAARCGIGRNTFYYYFPNIPAFTEFDELYEAICKVIEEK